MSSYKCQSLAFSRLKCLVPKKKQMRERARSYSNAALQLQQSFQIVRGTAVPVFLEKRCVIYIIILKDKGSLTNEQHPTKLSEISTNVEKTITCLILIIEN